MQNLALRCLKRKVEIVFFFPYCHDVYPNDGFSNKKKKCFSLSTNMHTFPEHFVDIKVFREGILDLYLFVTI